MMGLMEGTRSASEGSSTPKVLFRVDSSPAILWKPVALYVVLGLLFSAACIGSVAFEARAIDNTDALLFLGLWLLASGIWTLTTVPWWWYRAGRTSYQVTDDQLQVLKAGRVTHSWPRSSVYLVRIDGCAQWSHFLIPFNVDGGVFPRMRIWTDEQIELAPIMLWGSETAWKAEKQLGQAVKSGR